LGLRSDQGQSTYPFEFGAEVGTAIMANGNLIVCPRTFSRAPFDGHTLPGRIEQTTIMLQCSGFKPTRAVVGLGYRGVDAENFGLIITHRGKAKRLDADGLKLIKWSTAIEPLIGHHKVDHRMDRGHLKGESGVGVHVVLCAEGLPHLVVAAGHRPQGPGGRVSCRQLLWRRYLLGKLTTGMRSGLCGPKTQWRSPEIEFFRNDEFYLYKGVIKWTN
jgi:hypothetical protein